jgi:uncharacterized protein YndB with AHSA1/START domain
MEEKYISEAAINIEAPIEKVWEALVNPDLIKQYMFGTHTVSDWKEGSAITWSGEWEGKPYIDKGNITKIVPTHQLVYTHFSPLTGKDDRPENYHTVTINLAKAGANQTRVSLSQDNNANGEAKQHTQRNWEMVLKRLKAVVEN